MESSLASIDEDSGDIRTACEIVHFMYQNYDIFEVLLTKGQWSAYEDIVSWFADWGEQYYHALAERMAVELGVPEPDHYMIHWMAHMQVDVFVHLFTHESDEEKAVRHMEEIVVIWYQGNGLFMAKKMAIWQENDLLYCLLFVP